MVKHRRAAAQLEVGFSSFHVRVGETVGGDGGDDVERWGLGAYAEDVHAANDGDDGDGDARQLLRGSV